MTAKKSYIEYGKRWRDPRPTIKKIQPHQEAAALSLGKTDGKFRILVTEQLT